MRFTLLNDLKSTFERSLYIYTYRSNKETWNSTYFYSSTHWYKCFFWLHEETYIGTATCPLYNIGVDSIHHILLYCSYFKQKRENLNQNIELELPRWRYVGDDMKSNSILGLKCPNVIGSRCSDVHNIYALLERCVVNLWFCMPKRVI